MDSKCRLKCHKHRCQWKDWCHPWQQCVCHWCWQWYDGPKASRDQVLVTSCLWRRHRPQLCARCFHCSLLLPTKALYKKTVLFYKSTLLKLGVLNSSLVNPETMWFKEFIYLKFESSLYWGSRNLYLYFQTELQLQSNVQKTWKEHLPNYQSK